MRSKSTSPSTKRGRLRGLLTKQIQTGQYEDGDFLPSEPSLAQQFDISRGTVRQALAELENDGLVERIPGRGTLVCMSGGKAAPSQNVKDSPRAASEASLAAFAIVLPEIQSGHYPSLVNFFDEAAGELHHQILVCTTANDVRKQGDIVLQLIDKKIAGVALSPPTFGASPAHQIRQLQQHGIPVVLLHRPVDGISAPLIALNYERIAGMAANALVDKGHKRIALLFNHPNIGAQRYERGFIAAVNERGGSVDPNFIFYGDAKSAPERRMVESGRFVEVDQAIKKLMDLPEEKRPTAAFAPWAPDGESVYLSLIQQGVEIPAEFSIVSFGGLNHTGTLSRRITSVAVNEREFAGHAASLLDGMCRGLLPIDSNQQLEITVSFYAGDTLAQSPAPRR